MALTGAWKGRYVQPYSGSALKWGSGINPVHQFYGGPPERVTGRYGNMPQVTPPSEGVAGYVQHEDSWGFNPDDIAGLDVYSGFAITGIPFYNDPWRDWLNEDVPQDQFPPGGFSVDNMNVPNAGAPAPIHNTPAMRGTVSPDNDYAWGQAGIVREHVRGLRAGERDQDSEVSNLIPTETVSEGWENKPASGEGKGLIPDANPADDSQVFVQTSMTQRYKERGNGASLLRATDEPRAGIMSRIAPMKLKVFSEGQRNYDMFPKEQDDIPRPFWYRTAGTGRQQEMLPNEQWYIRGIQRVPPPDAGLGQEETSIEGDYTPEDVGWW